MKKLFLSLVVAMFALAANAQGFRQMNPEDMAKFQVERIKEACGTTDEQNKALTDIFVAQSKQMMEQMQAGGDPQGFDREAMRKRMEETTAKVKEILSEEQFAKYEEMQKQMRQRMGGGRPGGFRRQ